MTFAISGHQDMRGTADLRAGLLDAMAAGTPLALDLSGLESADLAVFQLIEAARREAVETGGDLTLAAPVAGPLRESLEAAGFLHSANPAATTFWLHGETAQ